MLHRQGRALARELPMELPLERLSGVTESTTQESEQPGILDLALLSISCVTLGKSLNLSGTQRGNEGITLISISQSVFRGLSSAYSMRKVSAGQSF